LFVIPEGNLPFDHSNNIDYCFTNNIPLGEGMSLMQVNVQYAEEHLPDLLSAVDAGQEVEISRPDKPSVKLVASGAPASVKQTGKRVLGAGRGELRIPSDEEWESLDKELERAMLDSPLTTTGKI
jgi:antitoxin (DNA-binding transcriptional repressor) of toxin-antitoxin stability system